MNAVTTRILLSGLLAVAAALSARAAELYVPLHEIPVGGDGGWDTLTVDPAGRRLYVSHASSVTVIDTTTDDVVGEIVDTPGVHGIAIADDLDRVFTSNGRENKVGIVDIDSLVTQSKVETGPNPDIILYVPKTKEVYAFNGRGGSATVINASTGSVATTIALGCKPEFAAVDQAAGRLYVNLEDRNEVAVVDLKTHAVTARWPIAPGEEATGMDIDLAHHRLFLGCGNAMLLVLDSTDGHVVASLPAGHGIDGTAFDPGTGLVFTSNGRDGNVTIVREDTPDKFTVVQTLRTAPRARTIAVDPVSHKIYLPTAAFEDQSAGSSGRPKMLPGTFKVLVFGLTGGTTG